MSGEPTARGVRGVSAWCLRSIHIVLVVADQEHSDCVVPRYRYRTELVWRFVMPTAHANRWIVPLSFCEPLQTLLRSGLQDLYKKSTLNVDTV